MFRDRCCRRGRRPHLHCLKISRLPDKIVGRDWEQSQLPGIEQWCWFILRLLRTVNGMSKKELQIMIETAVENAIEKTLLDIFEDPDKGLRLKKKLRFRLARQKQAVQAG